MFRASSFVVAAIVAIAAVQSASAASTDIGGGEDHLCLPGATTMSYTDLYIGGVTYDLELIGSGNTDLDVYVYDELGRLIISSTSVDDTEALWFRLGYTQYVTIEVVNRGSYANCYSIWVW